MSKMMAKLVIKLSEVIQEHEGQVLMYEYMCEKLVKVREEKALIEEKYKAAYLVRETLMSE